MFALCHFLINMYEITFQVECQTESASLDYCWNDIMAPQTQCEFWLPGSEVVKLFSCSTQLSMKFIKVLINTEIIKIN